MSSDIAISLNQVSKSFKRYQRPVDRLKEILLPGQKNVEAFWALQDITLQVAKGETFGIIGRNGSGKSTLLQIVAGTLKPTGGHVNVTGRVSALLELGSGFNAEFTGRQNVFFNGRVLGLTQAEVEHKFDDIAAFADIGKFIDEPVKTYSSGMFVRLAFAVVIHVDPDVLIVDEALAVGDGIFVHRCMAKIKEFQDSGGTILFVSHDIGSVTRLCSEVAWLNEGKLVSIGEPSDIARTYQAWMYDEINAFYKAQSESKQLEKKIEASQSISESASEESPPQKQNPFTEAAYVTFSKIERFGTGRAEIVAFAVKNQEGSEISFVSPKDWIRICIRVLSHDCIADLLVGVTLFDHLRIAITGFNTYQYDYPIPELLPETVLDLEFSIQWPEIRGGSYVLEPAIASGSQDNHEMIDWLQLLMNIESSTTDLTFGIMKCPEVRVSHRISTGSEHLPTVH